MGAMDNDVGYDHLIGRGLYRPQTDTPGTVIGPGPVALAEDGSRIPRMMVAWEDDGATRILPERITTIEQFLVPEGEVG